MKSSPLETKKIKYFPGGLGPWFVAMLVNVSKRHKKHTHILAHTYPHLAIDILNKGNTSIDPTGNANFWIMLIKVGPFFEWEKCLSYLNLWAFKTRGQSKRIEYGIELYLSYCEQLSLTLWVQTRDKGFFQIPRNKLGNNNNVVQEEVGGGEDDEKDEDEQNERELDRQVFGKKDVITLRTIKRQKIY